MRTLLVRGAVFSAALAVGLAAVGCNKVRDNAAGASGPGPGMGGGPGMAGPGGPPSPIGEAMTRLGKGPNALTGTIGRELQTDPPAWDDIQPQTREYAQLAASLSKYDPPKGSKESWTKLSASYAESAASLDRAAAAKDKEGALTAHRALSQSCMGCHREHRPGPGGMGRPGGFGRPGGPPAGGPGGQQPAPRP